MGNKLAKTSSTNSKLKKGRSQSITWNFRYSTLRKNKIPKDILIIQPTQIPMDISQWLQQLELKQYEDNFKKFSGIEMLFGLSDNDIKKLGIKNTNNRTKIILNLANLRNEFKRRNESKDKKQTINPEIYGTVRVVKLKERHSIAVDSDTVNSGIHNNLNRCNSTIENTKDSSQQIYETLNVDGETKQTKQSKSCGDLVDMDATTPSSSDTQQESIVIKKALEWELSLDSRDLRSHAWYHGPIHRQRAEEILQKDGDFLIRDCASQPGNYVLSCRMKTSVLHFVINKIIVQPETVYERVQYQFEDDAYDTVPDLITFYVGSGKPISVASGARIQTPCNRIHPLTFYGNKIPNSQMILSGVRSVTPTLNSPVLRFNSYTQQQGNYNNIHHRSPMSSPPRTKRETPPRLPSKKQRSQSLTPIEAVISSQNPEKYCSADGVIQHNENNRSDSLINETIIENGQQTHSNDDDIRTDNDGKENNKIMSRSNVNDHQIKNLTNSISRSVPGNYRPNSRQSSLNRDTNESRNTTELNNTEGNQNKPPSPPPKPARTPSNVSNSKRENIKELPIEQQQQHVLNRVASYHASGSDSGNGSGDSSAALDLEITTPHRGVIIKNPRFMPYSSSSLTLKSFSDFDVNAAEQKLASMDIPILEQVSKFDLENFHTLLLPSVENKPLDSGALNTFRIMLSENGPRIIAQHITRIDIKLILGDLENESNTDNILEKINGIELLTLPHGKIFRNDLIERTQCLKLLVAITILTCQSDLERAETLDKWIQIAVETKTALGNLFGFCSIMLGICMPQIQRLDQTWHILRQKFTDSAFTFEAKLRPTLKNMNDCTNPQAPNTTVPHLLPYILLKDRNINDIFTLSNSISNQQSLLISTCINSWETNADDFGISILFAHLESARFFTKNLSLYKQNGLIVFKDSNSRFDELLSDTFRTEFHIKFLWGSKGSIVSSEDRHAKLEQVLELMAEKFCLTD